MFISFLLFSGHNFPSLNPSISDKENIQTLAKDSGWEKKFWSIKHKIDVKHIARYYNFVSLILVQHTESLYLSPIYSTHL